MALSARGDVEEEIFEETVIASALTALIALLTVSPPMRQPFAPLPIEREAARVLADQTQTFDARADLADRLRAALANPDVEEVRGRLALLWVRMVRSALGSIPIEIDATKVEPYRSWLAAHEADAFYAEPAGQWIMPNEALWRLHAQHRGTASAEPLAWEIAENGLPGECEGYPPCYLSGLNLLHAEYLRRHPRGAHAAEAVEQIRQSNEQSLRLASGPEGREFFDPKTGCEDLLPAAARVRAALAQAGVDAKEAIELVDALRALCG